MTDPAAEIAANKWTTPFEIHMAGDATPVDVAKAIISDRRPGTKFRIAPYEGRPWSDLKFIFGARIDHNPWFDAGDLCVAMGWRLVFDGDVCVMEPDPAPAGESMWEFEEDGP